MNNTIQHKHTFREEKRQEKPQNEMAGNASHTYRQLDGQIKSSRSNSTSIAAYRSIAVQIYRFLWMATLHSYIFIPCMTILPFGRMWFTLETLDDRELMGKLKFQSHITKPVTINSMHGTRFRVNDSTLRIERRRLLAVCFVLDGDVAHNFLSNSFWPKTSHILLD